MSPSQPSTAFYAGDSITQGRMLKASEDKIPLMKCQLILHLFPGFATYKYPYVPCLANIFARSPQTRCHFVANNLPRGVQALLL